MPYNTIFSGRSFFQKLIFSVILTLLIGLLDHITGYEISFSIFYIVPISITAWYAGKIPGICLSIFSALTWFTADIFSGHVYSHKAIPVWNAGVRLGFFIVIALLLARLKEILRVEKEMADIDSLTSLLNGRAFRESTTKLLDLCRRVNCVITLAYIDLDNFKQVNDTMGHSEGDSALRAVGFVLAQSLRSTDIVGRLGGDEFAIALPDTTKEQAETVIAKMHRELMKEMSRCNWPIGFSIGVMTFARVPINADEAIRYVDNLMYRVKKSGKNNIRYEELNDLLIRENS